MGSSIVVFVHGLWMTGRESLILRRRLEREFGYRVHSFRYRSVSMPMMDVTARLAEFVREVEGPVLHFVGHSLGGLVIYRFLERYGEQRPGRVVFLGTPSMGSRAAAQLARLRLGAAFVGRCGGEEWLTPCQRRWSAPRDLGIIAGTRAMGLGQFVARFHEESDGTVAVSETLLPGAADHITLPVGHLGMLLSARVARETGYFLEHGHFSVS
jgi:pimeloyl-ACP methyl ester carboxylesterase